jgi:putative FmdB family regulatory protein
MPIYEYRCGKCGETKEFLVGARENETVSCPICGSVDMERIMSAPSFLSHRVERAPGHTCCGREERCEAPPCSDGGVCRKD